ncbi:NAC domain-containing protein 82 [Lactuca sativa]|nr:NAC domain-containing protein 82 [Lactuca sativa]
MNRVTKTGFWKGTGKDKEVKYKGRTVAMRKTLIFHVGHREKRTITNWVMHEYRMTDEDLANQGVAQEAYVICRVFEKSGLGPKNGAQYGAPFEEKDWDGDGDDDDDDKSTVTSLMMVGVLVNPNNASCLTSTCPSTKTSDPNNASSLGPSGITSWEDERVTYVPINDDVMLTHGDLASLLQNNNTQEEVEDRNGKNVMIDDGIDILNELLDASNPHDLGQDMFNMDTFLGDDFWK